MFTVKEPERVKTKSEGIFVFIGLKVVLFLVVQLYLEVQI